jgi:probable F420-dependent oxidoreductase
MSFGTTLGSFGAGLVSGPTLCQWAEDIERLGFDTLLFRDHVLWHSPVLDPFTALAAFAARTNRVRLGTGVLLLPLRHPTLVAKAIASLDFLSNGRAILGVGVGGEFRQEYDACGVAIRERGRRADEALRAIKELWVNSPATFRGTFYQFEAVVMEPRPLQLPHPPIWVGGRSEAALTRAGKLGDGWLAYFVTPERFRTSLEKAREHWQRRGLSAATFTAGLVLYFCVAPTYEAARQAAAHYLATEYNQPFAHLVDKYCALGPVSECIATIERFAEAGVQHVNLIPIGPPTVLIEQLQQLAADLLPRFRR